MNENSSSKLKMGSASGCGCGPLGNGKPSCCGSTTVSPAAIQRIELKTGTDRAAMPKVISRIGTALSAADKLGAFKVRWGVGRMSYIVEPGLYALGEPDGTSEVLVTANYKLTFDILRCHLAGRSFWVLVLDTKGINVWCAAGKGTFGTDELVHRIRATGLDRVVSHRRVIVPQLGAPGVAAHRVREQTGFKVVYGPVNAADILTFVGSGLQATPSMRVKRFPLRERVVLIPVELVTALKAGPALVAAFMLLSGLFGPGGFIENLLHSGILAAAALSTAVVAGAVLTPVLLPFLPGRAFSLKSLPLGFAAGVIVTKFLGNGFHGIRDGLESAAWLLIVPALTAYLAMNFTGASTYTSLSGVKREMKRWLPLQISGVAVGLVLWSASRFVG